MKRVAILALCLLLVFMMAMPCFATGTEETEEYSVGHAAGHVGATYGESGASTGAVIGIASALVIAACAVVLYLKKKRC
jgi:hypothetical protein